MDIARNVGPLLALVIGVVGGWMWGDSSLPEPRPTRPVETTCPGSPREVEVSIMEVEVEVLKAELEEGW